MFHVKLCKLLKRKRKESNLPSQSMTGLTGFEVLCPLRLKDLWLEYTAFLAFLGLCCVPFMSHADEFTTGAQLRTYLTVRTQYSEARYPRPICRAKLYDITAGTTLIVQGWSNVTNDTKIDNVGYTCELHLCDPKCEYGIEASRFDKLGGVAQGGGSNVTRDMHHAATSRYGRIALLEHRAEVAVELQCRAYNKRARGERLTIDGCGVDVQSIPARY